ncbi:DUF3105 domain-containing protein [Micromonospora sp. NBC_01796]|uniref:DUF3105 domain-containing protein n=1 Tax=Micromonospora sp. NBC_01796 TaxID=2975987 RepID=UPI002DDA2BCD|nr:DUF3105 domain-containing protein [Micromonospora sp. NBC_01796]WSA83850.1 DUF3105 domain-containing protein [Micromonospora sp. NBC_01796]
MTQQTRQSDRLASRRAEEARQAVRKRRRVLALSVVAALVLATVVAVLAVQAWSSADEVRRGIDPGRANVAGEVVYRDLARNHVTGPVDYAATPVPPVGGPHDGTWQNANGDVYEQPIRAEHAVHSLEHGAVWVTYRGDVSRSDWDSLRAKVEGVPYRMMSPLPQQPAPIMLTAWGHQLSVDSAGDARIDEFLTAYTQGPQAPEPGAPVTGGRAAP